MLNDRMRTAGPGQSHTCLSSTKPVLCRFTTSFPADWSPSPRVSDRRYWGSAVTIIRFSVVELVGFPVRLNFSETEPQMIRQICGLIACHCETVREKWTTGLVIRLSSDQAVTRREKNVVVIESMRIDFHLKIHRSAIATIHGSTPVYVARTVYTASLRQTVAIEMGRTGDASQYLTHYNGND
jgi:hypothetical protein